MEQRLYSKVKHSASRLGFLKTPMAIKSLRAIPTEWKLLYSLLLVMVLRLVVSIILIINQH